MDLEGCREEEKEGEGEGERDRRRAEKEVVGKRSERR